MATSTLSDRSLPWGTPTTGPSMPFQIHCRSAASLCYFYRRGRPRGEGEHSRSFGRSHSTLVATATAETKIDPVIKPPLQPVRPGPIERISGSAKRFISSFRGRTVHGIEASLPKGYSGIVLRGDAEGRTQTTTGKAKRQPAVPEDNMAGILPPEEERPVRVLKPSARFDSFVLWHPDIPVDEEMDEYLRSLSGSTSLLRSMKAKHFQHG
ncbi:hypothetical protein EDB84DRAFT_1674610 [Lactarius hengduanensis]|nr:hypothetical protein EDB84DRAFT_1674610 [Lactarius hengduanensis]